MTVGTMKLLCDLKVSRDVSSSYYSVMPEFIRWYEGFEMHVHAYTRTHKSDSFFFLLAGNARQHQEGETSRSYQLANVHVWYACISCFTLTYPPSCLFPSPFLPSHLPFPLIPSPLPLPPSPPLLSPLHPSAPLGWRIWCDRWC